MWHTLQRHFTTFLRLTKGQPIKKRVCSIPSLSKKTHTDVQSFKLMEVVLFLMMNSDTYAFVLVLTSSMKGALWNIRKL